MDQIQKLTQALVPIVLFNFLHALYRACNDPKIHGEPETGGNPQKVLTDKSNPGIMEVERTKDLPPWIKKIGRSYMFGYLRGVTTEEGYKKVMSRRGRSPGGKRK